MPTITQHPPRRLIRELPTSLRPATRLARVGSNQLTITELIAIVLNTSDALDLAQEIVCRFTIEDLPQTTLTELQQLYGIGPSRAGQLLAAIELGRRLVNIRSDHPQIKKLIMRFLTLGFLSPWGTKRSNRCHLICFL